MITFTVSGDYKKTYSFLAGVRRINIKTILDANGKRGVTALSRATPVSSGLVAHSWTYSVTVKNGSYELVWNNTDIENGYPVAIMIQYGHGTGTGGYIQGQDYINPAIRPIFDDIANKVWKAVTSA